MTWKVAKNIYQHIDVREEGKENAFSIGKSLWIENEVCFQLANMSSGFEITKKYCCDENIFEHNVRL